MCTRIARLWQPGDPQTRVYLTDFWVRFIESPRIGRFALPENAALFEVHPSMSRLDVRQYLEKIYGLPVRDVRTRNVIGKITYDNPISIRYRRALWKEPDQKMAYVFVKKGFPINVQFKFMADDNYAEEELEKKVVSSKEHNDAIESNEKFVNQDRPNVGKLLV